MSQVSIIVPIYNSEKFLSRCLNSIREQTFDDFEVIMINDGSTDNSSGVCEEYCKSDARFKLVNQKNAGPSAARNRGIDEADSKYLSFIDADDWVEPDFIEQLYNAAEQTDADITVCSYIVDYPDKSIKRAATHLKPGLYVGQDCREIAANSMVSFVTGVVGYSVLRLVRREFLQNSGYRFNTSINRSEDSLLWTQLSFKANRLCLITDKHPYHYVMNENSITHKYMEDYWSMVKTIHNELRKTLPDEEMVIKKINHAFLLRTFTAMQVSSLADNKKVFLRDFKKIVKDELLDSIIRSLNMSDVPKHIRMHLGLFKLRLHFILRLIYLRKFYSSKKTDVLQKEN